jgi:DNA-binding MarR family transcriptional regulator
LTDYHRNAARLGPLLTQLALTYRRRAQDIPPTLRTAGSLGERHVGMLITLAMAGPMSVSDLAKHREMAVAHASLVVGELANAGLVDRYHDPRDRRRIIVSLSAAAEPAIAEMRQRNAGPVLNFLRELDQRQADEFIDHLAALLAHLQSEGPAPEPKTTP